MPSPLSTFSSSLRKSALPWVLLGVAAVELAAGRILPPRAFSHEVDVALHQIGEGRERAPVLLIGDSVTITVIRIQNRSVRIGIDAPHKVRVLRAELSNFADKEHRDVEAYSQRVLPR